MYLPVTLIWQLADRSIIVTGFLLIAIGFFEPLVQREVFDIQKPRLFADGIYNLLGQF